MKQFILNYELKNGKMVNFEFNEDIDFEKYNKTIIGLYGKQIKRRFVTDMQTGDKMSLKELKSIIEYKRK